MSDEKRMAGDYEIIQSVYIGDREIVVGENQADSDGLPYLVAYYESNAILGRYYDAVGSDDFLEIMEIYGQRITEQAQKTREELSKPKLQGIDNRPITAEGCTPISYDDDLNGKVIVIKPEVLRPEYRRATSQVKLCTGGFGAYPHSRGSAVFAQRFTLAARAALSAGMFSVCWSRRISPNGSSITFWYSSRLKNRKKERSRNADGYDNTGNDPGRTKLLLCTEPADFHADGIDRTPPRGYGQQRKRVFQHLF